MRTTGSILEAVMYGPLHVESGADGQPQMHGGCYAILDEKDRRVAIVDLDGEYGVLGTVRRARLMASAPTLLAALETVRQSLRGKLQGDTDYNWECGILNRAIGIAEGRIQQPLGDCESCDNYILSASEAPFCPSCARERKEAVK